MKRMRIVISVLVCFSVLILSTDLALADDTSADDWETSGGNTYVTSGNVGIGTTTPNTPLHVYKATGRGEIFSDGSTGGNFKLGKSGGLEWELYNSGGDFRITDTGGGAGTTLTIQNTTGNVGIGTTTPNTPLHVYKATGRGEIFSDGSTGGNFKLGKSGGLEWELYNSGGDFKITDTGGGAGTTLTIQNTTGNVGIGTTSPGVGIKLDVVGKVRAHEVMVNLDNPADFVFEDNYNLPTLNKVESFIKNNKHLPDLPSGKELKENGIGVSEMMSKQMQKIEELTLYVIEQNKKIEKLEKKLAELEERK